MQTETDTSGQAWDWPSADGRSRGKVSQTFGAAREKLAGVAQTARDRTGRLTDTATDYVARYPFSTVAAAAGIGFLVGWLAASNEWIPTPGRRRWF